MAVWIAAFAVSVAAILAPAIWNGFPFMYYDVRGFVALAYSPEFNYVRSIYYAWFLRAASLGQSFWLPAAAQAAITGYVLILTTQTLAPGLRPAGFVLVVALLVVGTAMPWVATQLIPDFLAAPMVLAIGLLGFHWRSLGIAHVGLLTLIILFATLAHPSLLPLAGGLAGVLAIGRSVLRRFDRAERMGAPELLLLAAVLILSVCLTYLSNYARTGEWFFSKAGANFYFARMVQNGLAQRLLDDACSTARYRACAYAGALPETADDWLWKDESPFATLGRFDGMSDEAGAMIADSIKRLPLAHLRKAGRATLDQLQSFATGEGIFMFATRPSAFGFSTAERAQDQVELLKPVLSKYFPQLLDAYLAARQQNEAIALTRIGYVHGPVVVLSILVLLALAADGWRRHAFSGVMWIGLATAALLGNAFICGAISGPHHRYEARLIWILPLLAILLTLSRRSDRTRIPG